MVKIIRPIIGRLIIDNKAEWYDAVKRAVFGYRTSPVRGVISPSELLYGVKPKLVHTKDIEVVTADSHDYCQAELLAPLGHRPGRGDRQQGSSGDKSANTEHVQVGDLILVAYGEVFCRLKWLASSQDTMVHAQ